MNLSKTTTILKTYNLAILAKSDSNFDKFNFTEEEQKFISKEIQGDKSKIVIHHLDKIIYIIIPPNGKKSYKTAEYLRQVASQICRTLNYRKEEKLLITSIDTKSYHTQSFIEALILKNYTFNKYFTKDLDKKNNSLSTIKVLDDDISKKDLEKIEIITRGVFIARDLVNEPYCSLNSVDLSNEIKKLSQESGFSLEVLEKRQIEALKMGGILNVNKASDIPPTFSIMEWKPLDANNDKPIVLVGKGIVFDTGGYSLKPSQYMLEMKSDMGGGAAVIGAMYSIAKLKLPYHVIGLVPSTDNMIGKDGYVPDDIITMYNGMTVEIQNTDAEGRLILADALSYAKKYDPELVIDMATLTGAAVRAIGNLATAMMGNADKSVKKSLIKSGKKTYERLMEFPMWEEYDKLLKSTVADLKNIGGAYAGHITAGKFLENFTDYPWIHLDIAPTAFLSKNNDYRGIGGTGTPVRLLINFIENYKK